MESARSRAKSTEVGERGNLCVGEAYGHDINNCSPSSPFSYPNLVLAGDANGKEPHGWHRVYAKDAGNFFIFNLFFNFILKITHLDIYLPI